MRCQRFGKLLSRNTSLSKDRKVKTTSCIRIIDFKGKGVMTEIEPETLRLGGPSFFCSSAGISNEEIRN